MISETDGATVSPTFCPSMTMLSPESAETEREKAVRLNREASLRKTLELIRVINEEAAPEKEEEAPKHD